MEMVHFKKLNVNLQMISKALISTSLFFTFQVFGEQYALTVMTNSKGNVSKSISHLS